MLHLLFFNLKSKHSKRVSCLVCLDFYTAWDVIAKHVQGYKADPIIAHR